MPLCSRSGPGCALLAGLMHGPDRFLPGVWVAVHFPPLSSSPLFSPLSIPSPSLSPSFLIPYSIPFPFLSLFLLSIPFPVSFHTFCTFHILLPFRPTLSFNPPSFPSSTPLPSRLPSSPSFSNKDTRHPPFPSRENVANMTSVRVQFFFFFFSSLVPVILWHVCESECHSGGGGGGGVEGEKRGRGALWESDAAHRTRPCRLLFFVVFFSFQAV